LSLTKEINPIINDNQNNEFYSRNKFESTKAWVFETEKAFSNYNLDKKQEAEMRRDEEPVAAREKKGSRYCEKIQNLLDKILCVQFCKFVIKKISNFCLKIE
jgi:hypothetical protein